MWNSKSNDSDELQPSTFEGVIAILGKVVAEVVKPKRRASQRARLKLIQLEADRAEGKVLDMSREQQSAQVSLERALEDAWAAGALDAIEIEIEERRLAVRRLGPIVPIERAAEAEALEKLNAARREWEAARGRAHSVAMRLGEEQSKLEVLDQERVVYQRLAERIARGEHPKLWQGAGNPPQRAEFVPFTWQNFARQYYKNGLLGFHDIEEGRVQMADVKRRAEEATRIAREEDEKQYRDQCEMARLRISRRELALHHEDHSPEAA